MVQEVVQEHLQLRWQLGEECPAELRVQAEPSVVAGRVADPVAVPIGDAEDAAA